MASSDLLKQIQAGRKLKHTETSDRSAPQIDSSSKDLGRSNGAPIQKAPFSGGGELGGLFAGGMPKLKHVGPSKLGTLGKPPSIPKANGSLAPTPPPRHVPKPPARSVPSERNSSAPPPPPRRPPPATNSSSPVGSAPAPPARRPPPAAKMPAAHIDSTYPRESTVLDSSNVPPTITSPPRISYFPPPPSRQPLASSNGDTSFAPRRKIPSPSPNAGEHTFPVTGFPPPRDFKKTTKIYKSGSQRGSTFDLGS